MQAPKNINKLYLAITFRAQTQLKVLSVEDKE